MARRDNKSKKTTRRDDLTTRRDDSTTRRDNSTTLWDKLHKRTSWLDELARWEEDTTTWLCGGTKWTFFAGVDAIHKDLRLGQVVYILVFYNTTFSWLSSTVSNVFFLLRDSENDLLINHNCKSSCRLIQDSLFTNWKFGFDSDPRLHDLKRLVHKLFHFVFYFFMENWYHRRF